MKRFVSLLVLCLPVSAFAANKTYSCKITGDAIFSNLDFTLDENQKLVSGQYDFDGSSWVGLDAQAEVPLIASDVSVGADGTLNISSEKFADHDGASFWLSIKDGVYTFTNMQWVDCVGSSSWVTPITCDVK